MTYSIIAACPETGRIGVAIAGRGIAVGFSHVHIVAKVGAMIASGNRDHQTTCLPLQLIELGLSPSGAIAQGAIKDCPAHGTRQVALIDSAGQTEIWSDASAKPWSGQTKGAGFTAFGEGLAGQHVTDAMADAFTGCHGQDLDIRLLAALEAGAAAGGLVGSAGPVPARSAAIIVYGLGRSLGTRSACRSARHGRR